MNRGAHNGSGNEGCGCSRFVALTAVVAGICLTPSTATAQTLDTVVTLSTGSGISVGKGDSGAVGRRSPAFVEVDVGLIFDGDDTLEWTPSLLLELDGRVSVGVNPSLKRVVDFDVVSVYGGLGVPFFFAPFTLIGAEVAVGAFYEFWGPLAAAVEFRADAFFAGSDLPDDRVVAKLDFAVGLRCEL